MKFLDGLRNVVSGLGTGADKAAHNTYGLHYSTNPYEIQAAYQTSWYGHVVDIIAEDSFREWRSVQAEGDQIEAIEAEEARLGTRQKFMQAYKWALAEGGAAVLMGGLPGGLNMPVNPNAVTIGSIKYLTALTRQQITPNARVLDPADPRYGEPEYYTIGTTRVHPSRVIRFVGMTRAIEQNWDGWGDPLWFRLRDAVTHLDATSAGMAALVQEAKTDVYLIPGLNERVATAADEQRLTNRFIVADRLKSLINAIVLDAGDSEGKGGEQFEQKQISFAGLQDVWDRHALALSGMAGIAQTRMFGRAPQGMNATGDGDEANHAKMIKMGQELKIAPAIETYNDIVIRSALGSRPPEIYFEWRSLYAISEKDGAEIEAKYAEGFAKRLSTGAIQDDVLAKVELNRMTETGRYSGIEDAISDSENDGIVDPDEREQAELTRMQAEAEIAAAQAPRVAANDAAPKTLYVRRDVVNAKAIRAHYTAQGVDVMPAEKMHVTIIYSREPVDWFAVGEAWEDEIKLPKGGARAHDLFGPPGAEDTFVLMIKSQALEWRNAEFIRHGAKSSYNEYQPHISLSKYGEGSKVDIANIKPWVGPITLGPEIFEEVKEG